MPIEARADEWEQVELPILRLSPIEERIHLPAMSMQIQKQPELLPILRHPLLNEEYFRVRLLRWGVPLPIQVTSRKIGSVVAERHAVNVDHGDNLEDKLASQLLGLQSVAQQRVQETLKDERRWRLACMLPCQHIYYIFASSFGFTNRKQLYLMVERGPADLFPSDEFGMGGDQPIEIVLQFLKRVWEAI